MRVGAGKLKQTQTPLPALSAGEHTLTLITASEAGDGGHWSDYLKLDGVIAPKPRKPPEKTMAKKKTTPAKPEETPTSEKKKSYVPTSQTGLQDYSYWGQYVKEQAEKSQGETKPFRRGRIWA